MSLAQLCQEIKSLIEKIFTAHQHVEKNTQKVTDTSESKAREAVKLLTEFIKDKDIAALQLKYSNEVIFIANFQGNTKQFVWNRRYGLAMKSLNNNSLSIEPLIITEGNFPIEQLVKQMHTQLTNTLNTINKKNNDIAREANKRIKELDQLIDCLNQLD